MDDRMYLLSLLTRLDKQALYEAHRASEADFLSEVATSESLRYTIVQTAVSFERLLADLREGPNSANYEYALWALTSGSNSLVTDLLTIAGQEATDKFYNAAAQLYDAHYASTRKAWEAERNGSGGEEPPADEEPTQEPNSD